MALSGLFRSPRKMSAFRVKADTFSSSTKCPLLTQSGHTERARNPFDKEVLAALGRDRRLLASDYKRLAVFLALGHRVHYQTDNRGNNSSTHATAHQLTSERC